MKNILYIANLAPDVTDEQLREVLKDYGGIINVEFGVEESTQQRYALVEMEKEKEATRARNTLNGYKLNERYLAVTSPTADIRDKLSTKQQAVLEQIAAALNETEEIPLRQLQAIVMLCGTNFAEALLKETEQVESSEGIKTTEGDRRRTRGGVFFYLARYRMAKPIRGIVYNRKGKMPSLTPDAATAVSNS